MFRTVFALAGILLLTGCGKNETAGTDKAAPADEGVILAIEHEPIPLGKVHEEDFSMELKDAKMVVTVSEKEMEGSMSMKEIRKGRIEPISEGKCRITVLEERKTQKNKMMGREQPSNEEVSAIEGLPVVAERGAGGVWTAALETGVATAEMDAEIEGICKKLNQDLDARIYGTVPRKVGDEWTADASVMAEDLKDATGVIKLRFESIEEYEGQRCAKLTGSMDITGAPSDGEAPGLKMRMSGDVVIYRSIEHRTDLSNHLKGTMEVSGDMEPQPGMKMKMNVKGDMESHGVTTITDAK